MRLLYIGFNRMYINATMEVTLSGLGRIGQLDFFGPGFQSHKIVNEGLESWVDSHCDYDFIITDSFVMECDNILKRQRPFSADFISFYTDDYPKHVESYLDFFMKYSGKKIFVANLDIYNIESRLIKRIETSNAFIFDSAVFPNSSKVELEEIHGLPVPGNDHWYNFIMRVKNRVLSVPHTIGAYEFDQNPLDTREREFSVIGAPYVERKEAYKILSTDQRFRILKNRVKSRIMLPFVNQFSEMGIMRHRVEYLSTISDSKFCYCSGGPWMAPVRKFFEIPARGAIAIGHSCNGFEHLGFKDNENFIVARSNTKVIEAMKSFSFEELQVIADNGRNLIWKLHSDWARSAQLKQSLGLILEDRFRGSHWDRGVYKHY